MNKKKSKRKIKKLKREIKTLSYFLEKLSLFIIDNELKDRSSAGVVGSKDGDNRA